MTLQAKTYSFLATLWVLYTLPVLAQSDFNSRVIIQTDKLDSARAQRSEDDKRLGYFYQIVSLAEKADTSEQSKEQLKMYVDNDGRIDVHFVLRDISTIDNVVKQIKALDGIVINSGKYVAYIIGKVYPKSLRQIVKSDDVLRVDPVARPVIKPWSPN